MAIPLVYSNIGDVYNSLYYFAGLVRMEVDKEVLDKKMWLRDRKGKLSFVTIGVILGEGAQQAALGKIREEIDRVNQARRRGLHCGLTRFKCR